MAIARYNGVAQALHWLTAAALCGVLPFVWVAENFPPGSTRVFWYLLHESTGIMVFLLVLLRITWRWRHDSPPPLPGTPRWAEWFAHLNHALLYLILLVMPITGYMMAGNGRPVPVYRLFSLPGFPTHDALGQWANQVHVAGQFVLYTLVILHVAATAWHVAVRRDGLLERMLPPQRPRD
ncbi:MULTISPECIES: cytochrome b [unclassified Pseudomonas]|uniref:cytochrome b n=1 Tax=unclassified Pseudomonas TaxID=196821 RepID=UPI000BC89D73|nr:MULTISPECIES: cytochrome b [unclassified Pseudomonas]PVZ19844.1 cytochrome b561 [Pseudomonas sp. URIL14HWK12:I12]PVZ26910.1 cytochrome b561 [Pseudomonas sp. URIL14HWK12:I10]PVZ37799.1 cytochrome b561 [Pseudomonas sp. URIL14HWK12:I11]SNZ05622.1 cytochrome b561 [Pseudomonas sp. URIL14HWK12:I9]